jgi:phosphoheptose isomerase
MNAGKRLAFISEHASPLATLGGVDSGGQNVYVAQTACALARLGYTVDIFTRRDDPNQPTIVNWQPGVRVIHVEAGPPSFVRKEELLPLMDAFSEWMVRFIQQEAGRYALVHAHFFMSALVASRLKQQLGLPYVVTFHALGKVRLQHQGKTDAFPPVRLAIEEMVVREADRIIAECPQDRIDLIELYQATPAKLAVIPCGCNLDEFYPVDRPLACSVLGLDPQKKYLLQLGRMVPRKGVETVIRSFAHYLRQHTTASTGSAADLDLLIVGGEETPDTPEINRLRAIAVEEGVHERVHLLGRRDREVLKYYYSVAEFFITVPWYEPFGITPLEAMACGVPVIGAAVGGIKFTVQDQETGLLVPPQDPAALATAMAKLLHNPALLAQMRINALQRVRKQFTWEKVAGQLDQLYQTVARPQPTAGHRQPPAEETVDQAFSGALVALKQARQQLRQPILQATNLIGATLAQGGKLLICGNGGSAADAQHWATEFVGRFLIPERPGYPAIALCADGSLMTAWANDFGFETVFARQVQALGQPWDVLICISTSGNSRNLVQACRAAAGKGMPIIGLLGNDGGALAALVDVPIIVPSHSTPRIQEVHLHILHTITELVENHLTADPEPACGSPYPQETIERVKANYL